jgi:hypothetical protein
MSIDTKLLLWRLFEFINMIGGFMVVAWQTTLLTAIGMSFFVLGVVLAHIRINQREQ